jgi:predicted porin
METQLNTKLKWNLAGLACLSAMSGIASAQSSVTVYGVLDLGILSQTNVANPALGYLPNPTNKGKLLELKDGGEGQSYWGIKGDEDLGGGLKANFNLQGNFQSNTGVAGGPNSSGTTSMFNQQANVGLSGNAGSVQAGRVISPIYFAFASTDVRGGGYFGSALTALVGLNSATGAFSGGNSNGAVGTIYNDNAIVYTTPVYEGLVGSLEYVAGGVAGDSSALRQEAATLTYDANNLRLDALYYNGDDDGVKASANPNGTNTNRLISAGAMLTLDNLLVGAEYFKGTNPSHSGAGLNPAALGGAVTSGDLSLYTFGLGYQFSPQIKLTSGVYRIRDEDNSGNRSTMFALGVDYYLSKSTGLYLEGANVKNQGSNMNQAPVYATPVAAGGFSATSAGLSSTAWMVGIRHKF